jgi:hypothetical protein
MMRRKQRRGRRTREAIKLPPIRLPPIKLPPVVSLASIPEDPD